MPIDELTKQEALQRRSQIESRIRKNQADIAKLVAQRLALVEENKQLKAKWDALKKDIPEPTPPEPVPV